MIKKIAVVLQIAAFFLAGGNFFPAGTAFAQEAVVQEKQAVEAVSGEVLVKLKESAVLENQEADRQLEEISTANGLEKTNETIDEGVAVLKMNDNSETITEKIRELEMDPRVASAQPNFIYHSFAIASNDLHRDQLWGLDNFGQSVNGTSGAPGADISINEAWNVSEGAENQVVVAVLDDGVFYAHEDLAANMWNGSSCVGDNGLPWNNCLYGYDFFANDNNPMSEGADSHGTWVAGVIGAAKNNNKGGSGVAPRAKIMALRIGGGGTFTTDKAVRAIAFAKNNGARVINASWGGNQSDPLLKSAIESFDGLFVTSAGNDGSNNEASHIYPCDLDSPNIICTAATDQHDALWVGAGHGSNYGAVSVDLGAPGVNILSTSSSGVGDYALLAGTSMASPFVTGAAALLWGREATLAWPQVKARILETGDSLPTLTGKTLTGRRLNAYAALTGTLQASLPFAASKVEFNKKEVKVGKTKKTKVSLNFKNVGQATQFVVSRRADFAAANWQTIKSKTNVLLKKTGKTQTFYVKFRDSNGTESGVFIKKVKYTK